MLTSPRLHIAGPWELNEKWSFYDGVTALSVLDELDLADIRLTELAQREAKRS